MSVEPWAEDWGREAQAGRPGRAGCPGGKVLAFGAGGGGGGDGGVGTGLGLFQGSDQSLSQTAISIELN